MTAGMATKRSVLVSVLGHVDHGKTALVHALTGVDTDRLPDEKRRGMTIEPGFARLETSGHEFDIVDVPGHADYLPNALRSLTATRIGLLCVDAREGPMPQTVEHVWVARGLGVTELIVALTKCDCASRSEVEAAARSALEITGEIGSWRRTVVATSARTWSGIDEVMRALDDAARRATTRPGFGRLPRFAVDRAFTARGVGLVVTGVLESGRLDEGAELDVFPGGGRVRVRSIERHGRRVQYVRGGERAGINLAGASGVERGTVLLGTSSYPTSTRFNAVLQVAAVAPRPLLHNDRVYAYHLARELKARVALFGTEKVNPGEEAYCQISLEEEAAVFWGDTVFLRFMNPPGLVGYARVVDVRPPRMRLGTIRYLSQTSRWAASAESLVGCPLARSLALTAEEISRETGIVADDVEGVVGRLAATGVVVAVGNGRVSLARVVEECRSTMRAELEALRRHPNCPVTMPVSELRSRVAPQWPKELFEHVLAGLVADGALDIDGSLARLRRSPFHGLTRRQRRVAEEVMGQLRGRPPAREETIVAACGENPRVVRDVLRVLVSAGSIVRFGDGRYYADAAVLEAARRAVMVYLGAHGSIHAQQARDALGWGRRATIAFLEHLDRTGVTIRNGDLRCLAPGCGNQASDDRWAASVTDERSRSASDGSGCVGR